MRSSWALCNTFVAGTRATARFQLGPDPQQGELGQDFAIIAGSIRVGWNDRVPPDEYVANVVLPDDGGVIGPIDVPFELACELPVLVQVYAVDVTSVSATLIATACTPPLKLRWSAQHRLWCPGDGSAVVVPQWTHSVSVCEVDAAVSLFDATGALLCALTGPIFDVPRPRAAVLAATTWLTGTALTCHYSS